MSKMCWHPIIKYLSIFLLLSLLPAQGLTNYQSADDLSWNEYTSINSGKVESKLFLYPVRETSPGAKPKNLMKNYSRQLRVEPVLGIRYGNSGFEFFPEYTPSNMFWITPGVHLESTIPVINPMSGWWIYAWSRFNKHSAIGFDDKSIPEELQIAPYNPDISYGFYAESEEPDNGIDFDESEGGIALMSASFDLVLGKFRSGFGPSLRSNLGFSRNSPAMTQIRLHSVFSDKIHFTWHAAELQSEVIDSSKTIANFVSDAGFRRNAYEKRFLVNHRLDFLIKPNFRVGLYEQTIIGGRSFPFGYAVPIIPLWSIQHALGDLDNMQMGLDLEWIFKNARIYWALMLDEWAPYDTFDSEENHNWFSSQVGLSLTAEFFTLPFLINTEYSWSDPRTYIHRFDVNLPYHHQYPVGLWSGGNSDDLFVKVHTWFTNGSNAYLSYSNTRLGEQNVDDVYSSEIPGFLDGLVLKRSVLEFQYTYPVVEALNIQVLVKDVQTENIYNDDHFLDASLSFMYNIFY